MKKNRYEKDLRELFGNSEFDSLLRANNAKNLKQLIEALTSQKEYDPIRESNHGDLVISEAEVLKAAERIAKYGIDRSIRFKY